MAVPSANDAVRLLLELEPPAWLVAHSAAVAEVAAFLAERIAGRDIAVERPLVEAAALLHDIGKALPADDPLRRLGHADAGGEWLSRRGHPELAPAVANHPATLLTDEQRYPRWTATATREERIVAYADKRATQKLVPMAQRFREWEARHPEHAAALRVARERAERLEREVCAEAGVEPARVERRRWVAELLPGVTGMTLADNGRA